MIKCALLVLCYKFVLCLWVNVVLYGSINKIVNRPLSCVCLAIKKQNRVVINKHNQLSSEVSLLITRLSADL